MTNHPLRARLATLAAPLAILLVTAACRNTNKRPTPDEAAATLVSSGPAILGDFFEDILEEREAADADAVFAVFPALTNNRDVGLRVNGTGVYLAQHTARILRAKLPDGLVLSGDLLLGEMGRHQTGPEKLCSEDDLISTAKVLEATYVIFGNVEHRTESAIEGKHSISLRWSCLRLADSHLVAHVNAPEIRGAEAAEFLGHMNQPSGWELCR